MKKYVLLLWLALAGNLIASNTPLLVDGTSGAVANPLFFSSTFNIAAFRTAVTGAYVSSTNGVLNSGTLAGLTVNTGTISGGTILSPTINGTVSGTSLMTTQYLDVSGTNEAMPYVDIMSTHPTGTVFSNTTLPLVGSAYLYGSGSTSTVFTSTNDFGGINLATGAASNPRVYLGQNVGSQQLRIFTEIYFQSSGTGPDAATWQQIWAPNTMFTGGGFTGTNAIIHNGLTKQGFTFSVGTIGAFVTVLTGTWAAPCTTDSSSYLFDLTVSGSTMTLRKAAKSNPSVVETYSATSALIASSGGNTMVQEPFYNSNSTFDTVYVRQMAVSNTPFVSFQNTLDNIRQRISGTAISSNQVSGASPYFRNLAAAQSLLDAQNSIGLQDAMHLGPVSQESSTSNSTTFSESDQGNQSFTHGFSLGDPSGAVGRKYVNYSVYAGSILRAYPLTDGKLRQIGKTVIISPGPSDGLSDGYITSYSSINGYQVWRLPSVAGGTWSGGTFGVINVDNLPVMTSNTTSTITFNTGGTNQTIYNSATNTLASATITLSGAPTVHGQSATYTTAGAITALTVSGSQALTFSTTTLPAGSSVRWEATGTTGVWVQVK